MELSSLLVWTLLVVTVYLARFFHNFRYQSESPVDFKNKQNLCCESIIIIDFQLVWGDGKEFVLKRGTIGSLLVV